MNNIIKKIKNIGKPFSKKLKINMFFNSLNKSLTKLNKFQILIFLAVIIGLGCWRLLNLYISHDDWDLFFKVVHPEFGVWGTGPGIFGIGPYRYFHTVFLLLFPFLNFNFPAYFLIGMIFYLFAAFCFYLLLLDITKNKNLSIIISFIFASLGYFGSDAIMHLQHLYAMYGMIGFSCLTLLTLICHFKTGKIYYLLLSILLFSFTEEFYVLRGHGLIFVIIFGTLLFAPIKKNVKALLYTGLKLLPFVVIYYHQYVSNGGSYSNSAKDYLLHYNGALGSLINFPATFSNSIVPDNVSTFLYTVLPKIFPFSLPDITLLLFLFVFQLILIRHEKNRKILAIVLFFLSVACIYFTRWAVSQPLLISNGFTAFYGFLGLLGFEIALIILIFVKINWRKNEIVSRILLFGLLWFWSQYIGYFIASPAYDLLNTGHRYMTPETAGSAMIFGSLIFLIRNIKLKYMALFILIGLFLIALNSVIADSAALINPTRDVYASIRKQTPNLPKNPLIFLDYENDPAFKGKVRDAYPTTVFALLYNRNYRIPVVETFQDLLKSLQDKKATLDDIQTYYVSKNFVKNTTNMVKDFLEYGSSFTQIPNSNWDSTTTKSVENNIFLTNSLIQSNEERSVSASPVISVNVDDSSVVPMQFNLTMTVSPINFNKIPFPYQDVSTSVGDSVVTQDDLAQINLQQPNNLPCGNRTALLKADEEHKQFVKTSSASATSYFGDTIVNNLNDGNYSTAWSAYTIHWLNGYHEEAVIDLGTSKSIKSFIWINSFKRSAPIDYSFSVSEDGQSWRQIKEVKNGAPRMDDEIVSEIFNKTYKARFIKMIITKTLSGVSPSLREIWVSQEDLKINSQSEQLISSPFYCSVESISKAQEVVQDLPTMKAKLWWRTNANWIFNADNSEDMSLIPDGVSHTYSFYLPAQGTKLQDLKISNFQEPVNIKIEQAQIKSLSFNEIIQNN